MILLQSCLEAILKLLQCCLPWKYRQTGFQYLCRHYQESLWNSWSAPLNHNLWFFAVIPLKLSRSTVISFPNTVSALIREPVPEILTSIPSSIFWSLERFGAKASISALTETESFSHDVIWISPYLLFIFPFGFSAQGFGFRKAPLFRGWLCWKLACQY